MSNPVAMLRNVTDGDHRYQGLMFICPGCRGDDEKGTGLHMLPVNTSSDKCGRPHWDWDGNLEAPTLNPSILTRWGADNVCHSYLRNGVFQYLDDCTHKFAGQHVPLPPLPDWITEGGIPDKDVADY